MARRRFFRLSTRNLFYYLLILIVIILTSSSHDDQFSEFNQKKSHMKEADYVNAYCSGKGITEYQLPDRTRVDCLTDEYAIEFDYAKKWAESIGQSLYYSKMTGKKPAVAIIIKNPEERIYMDRIKKVNSDIKIIEIKSDNYCDEIH